MQRLAARVARRTAHAGLSVALVLAITTLVAGLAPGRFGDELRLSPGLAPESVAAARGSDAEAAPRAFWRGLLRGDLGSSLATGLPVTPLVIARAVNTLLLTIPATVIAWAIALLVVSRRALAGGSAGIASRVAFTGLQTTPDLLMGLLLVRLASSSDWLPVGGRGTGLDTIRHAVLPVSGLALSQLPLLVRHMTALLHGIDRGLVVPAAAARGVAMPEIYWRHLLPAMLPGLAPLLAVSLATLFGSALVFEVVFDWPGLGALLLEAVFARDLPVVTGCVLASTVLLVAANAAGDVLQYLSDPRQRA
jgi:peptide/nickel transport system permease protein